VVGSGRSIPGLDLAEALNPFKGLLTRFGGHAQAVGLTVPLENLEAFQQQFNEAVKALKLPGRLPVKAEAQLSLAIVGKSFDQQLSSLEPFGEGNPAPVFELRMAEVMSVKNRWVRIRQGRYSIEALCWDSPPRAGARGDCLVEFRGKRRFLREFREHNSAAAQAI
jgi:single-stranded-DNA-specific exonuclease